jgi:uncharacterized protein with ParB-like and HNH nuclease domain
MCFPYRAADFTVNSIIDKINRNKVNLRPSYQREYVWTVRTASKLVESMMLNIPIPTMVGLDTTLHHVIVVCQNTMRAAGIVHVTNLTPRE